MIFTITVKELRSWKDKSVGLLNANKAYPVLFKTRFGIHTIGMKFPIDVLILDRQQNVVKLKKNLNPNNIFIWSPKFDTVVELPAGEIQRLRITIGDKIIIHPNNSLTR